MSTIWFTKEGEPHVGPPIAQKSFIWCVSKLGLKPDNWIAGLDQKNLVIGQKNTAPGVIADNRYVLIEIDDDDNPSSWQSGYYLIEMSPRDVRKIL